MRHYIGLDIGRRFVKVAYLGYKSKLVLLDAFMFPIPYDKKASAKTIDAKDFFDQITSHIPLAILKNAQIAINIPSSLVTVLVVNLPKMTKKELEIAAIAEARRKMLPTPGPNSIFNYLVSREVIIGKIPRFEVLIIKTEKNHVNDLINLFGVYPDIMPCFVSPSCYTVISAYAQDHELAKKEVAFVDLGYESIDIYIAKQGKLLFYRNVKFGFKDIIAHIATALNITPSDTEKVIIREGVPQVEIDINDKVQVAEEIMRQKYERLQGSTATEVNLLELRMLWSTEIERIVHEVRRTFIYYKEQTGGGRVDQVLFLGGGSKIKGLVGLLTNEVGGTCNVVPAFRDLEFELDLQVAQDIREKDQIFVPALSLAFDLAQIKKDKAMIDFLPEDLKRRRLIIQQQWAAIFGIIVVMSFIFLGWLHFFIDRRVTNINIRNLRQEMSRSKDIIAQLDRLQHEKDLLTKKSKKIIDIVNERIDGSVLLEKISMNTPENILLEKLMFKKISERNEKGLNLGTDKEQRELIYHLVISASCEADYQVALDAAKAYTQKLEIALNLKNIRLIPPGLEKIVPIVGKKDDIILTDVAQRGFKIEADIILSLDERF